jgi:hypothetical protein
MIALYSVSGGKEIKLSGTRDEWRTLAELLLVDLAEIKCKIVDPSPYSFASPKILVQHGSSNKVTIDLDSKGIVTVSGSPQVCRELSEFIQSLADDYLPGEHFHLDYIDCPFIDEQSAFTTLHIE